MDSSSNPSGMPRPSAPTHPDDLILRRTTDDCHVAGVAGGMARFLGVDPVFVRGAWVLLGLTGSGLVMYGLAWILIAEDGASRPPLSRLFGDRSLPLPITIAVGIFAALVLGDMMHRDAIGLVLPLLLIAAGLSLVTRGSRNAGSTASEPTSMAAGPGVSPSAADATSMPTRPPAYTDLRRLAEPETSPTAPHGPHPVAPPIDTGWSPTGLTALAQKPMDAPPGPSAPPAPVAARPSWRERRRARREPAVVTRLTLLSIAVLLGGLALAGFASGSPLTLLSALAAALATVGAGLVIASFAGRGRGLVPLGILLTVALAVGSYVQDLVVARTEQVIRPASLAAVDPSYAIDVGSLVIDLRSLDTGGLPSGSEPVVLRASVDFGELTIIAPEDLAIDFSGIVDLGAISTDGEIPGEPERPEREQPEPPSGPSDGPSIEVQFDTVVAGFEERHAFEEPDPMLIIAAEVGVGALHLVRTS